MTEDDRGAHMILHGAMCGEAIGLEKAADMLRARSGKLFSGGMDNEARAVRQLAAEIDEAARVLRQRCREYYDEAGLAPKHRDEDKP